MGLIEEVGGGSGDRIISAGGCVRVAGCVGVAGALVGVVSVIVGSLGMDLAGGSGAGLVARVEVGDPQVVALVVVPRLGRCSLGRKQR